MNVWTLPRQACFSGVNYAINADYRDVLEVIKYLTDSQKPEFIRWKIALGLFYEEEIPVEHQQEAMQFLADFIGYGSNDAKPGPKLLDWQKDAAMIVGDVNKVAGQEIRALPFLHWWTFLSFFYGIGEGQLSTVVSIRSKKARGQKLEKWEQKYYKDNKSQIDMRPEETDEERSEKDNMLKWL